MFIFFYFNKLHDIEIYKRSTGKRPFKETINKIIWRRYIKS
ncbi:MAG: hypothetical protein HGB01_03570 [Chlorobiaceae bacterium]|nr:hypothetical protein [Chlorobiaceae bacterium]